MLGKERGVQRRKSSETETEAERKRERGKGREDRASLSLLISCRGWANEGRIKYRLSRRCSPSLFLVFRLPLFSFASSAAIRRAPARDGQRAKRRKSNGRVERRERERERERERRRKKEGKKKRLRVSLSDVNSPSPFIVYLFLFLAPLRVLFVSLCPFHACTRVYRMSTTLWW